MHTHTLHPCSLETSTNCCCTTDHIFFCFSWSSSPVKPKINLLGRWDLCFFHLLCACYLATVTWHLNRMQGERPRGQDSLPKSPTHKLLELGRPNCSYKHLQRQSRSQVCITATFCLARTASPPIACIKCIGYMSNGLICIFLYLGYLQEEMQVCWIICFTDLNMYLGATLTLSE